MKTIIIKYNSIFTIAIVLFFSFNVKKSYSDPIEGIHTRNGPLGTTPRQYQFRDVPESIGYLPAFPWNSVINAVDSEILKKANLEYWVYTSVEDAEMAIVAWLDMNSLLLRNMIDFPLEKGLIGDNCWHTIKETGSVLFVRNNVLVFITPAIYNQFDPSIIEETAREIDNIIKNSTKVFNINDVPAPTIHSVSITSYPKDISDNVNLTIKASDKKDQKIFYQQYATPVSFGSDTGDLKVYLNRNMYLNGDSTKIKVKIWVWNEDHLVSSIEQIIPF